MLRTSKVVKVEIISVGTEIVLGRIFNTNQTFISRQLLLNGFYPRWSTVVNDDINEMIEAIKKALNRADLIVLTGGLGSTPDDLTRQAISKALSLPLKTNSQAEKEIRQRLKKVSEHRLKFALKQAQSFEGSRLYFSSSGTAPGFLLNYRGIVLVAIPGVPEEAIEIFSEALPQLKSIFKNRTHFYFKVLRTYGLVEAEVLERIGSLTTAFPQVEVGYLPVYGGVDIEVISEDKKTHQEFFKKIKKLLKPFVYGEDNQELYQAVGEILQKKGLTLSVAESCTAGLLAAEVTKQSGSSNYFLGGAISYSNEVKKNFLKVEPKTLIKYGAVSEQCAREMAENARKIFQSDIGLSITGIAGPSGGTKEKPVGLVYLGLSTEEGTQVWKRDFSGNREEIRRKAVLEILNLLRLYLKGMIN